MKAETQKKFVWGALIGGALGAIALLLVTPYSGDAIRRKIRRNLQRINGKAAELTFEAKRLLGGNVKRSLHITKSTKQTTARKLSTAKIKSPAHLTKHIKQKKKTVKTRSR